MTKTAWPPEKRAKALELYVEHGSRRTGEMIGVPGSTIRNWASSAGLAADRQRRLRETNQARMAEWAALREELRESLIEAAVEFVERARGQAGPRDSQSLMVAAGIALDKFRLEMGEVTGRNEEITLGMIERKIAELEAEQAVAEKQEAAQEAAQDAGKVPVAV